MQILQLRLSPEETFNEAFLKQKIAKELAVSENEITHIQSLKRSLDARQRNIRYNLKVAVYLNNEIIENKQFETKYQNVSNAEKVIIIGAGPAGLFAALRLIELGKKPIILERGKDIKARRRDLAKLNKEHIVNPESNYCFGEGGAGTYSDGKLYTRSKKRGVLERILNILVAHGAKQDILVDAHPHIGTNKLPQIIQNIRETIIEYGGEVHFNTKVVDFIIKNNQIRGVLCQNNDKIEAQNVILATGHSARDIFELLNKKKIKIEAKPFALGVRVEHPQALIDKIQYKRHQRGEFLPPASYKLVKQVKNRGVYSFCMCPGGIIAPCATNEGEVVTNGWSPSKRDKATSNSGIVVELRLEDMQQFAHKGELMGVYFQQAIEQKAWQLAGKTQAVPAQRLVDFVNGKTSTSIPKTSYIPGTTSVEFSNIFPKFIHQTLQAGFQEFGKMMKGYYTNEAVVHAPESRTSSPVRIPRNWETLEHPQIKGLYPCGEGAGYAGGILSAAIDGERCANAIET